jgi:hypothetical protein
MSASKYRSDSLDVDITFSLFLRGPIEAGKFRLKPSKKDKLAQLISKSFD